MLDHRNESNAEYDYDRKRNGFVIKATKDIKKGEEVFIHYRGEVKHNNAHLFYGYGFVNEPAELYIG